MGIGNIDVGDPASVPLDGLFRAAAKAPSIKRGDIQSLIDALPCLVRKEAPPFGNNADRWRQWMRGGGLSHGELVAAQFVLHVWNFRVNAKDRAPYRFDLGEAMNCWDDEHLATFASWARSPWYC